MAVLVFDGLTQVGSYGTIQAAVAAASDGYRLLIEDGSYSLGTSTLTIDKDLTVEGQSEAGVIIDASGIDGYGIFVSANGVSMSNFTLHGPAAGSPGGNYGIKIQPDTADPSDRLLDFSLAHVTVVGSARSEIDLNGVKGATLTDITADGAGTGGVGIAITDSADITLTDITTTGNLWGSVALYPTNGTYNQQVDNITFAGAYSTSNDSGIGIYSEISSPGALPLGSVYFPFAGGEAWVVTNDAYRGAGSGNFAHYLPDQASAEAYALGLQQAPNIVNNESVVTAPDGTIHVYEGMSIQAAVDAASDGANIVIHEGLYVEQVVINGLDNITISEAAGEHVVIEAPVDVTQTALSSTGRALNGVVTVLNGENVTINGVTVDGAGHAGTVDGPNANSIGVVYRNASGTLENVDVTGIRDPYAGGTTAGGNPVVSGNQRGVGVQVDNDTQLAFAMHGGSITDFQKNATVFSNADLDVSGVTITGGGAQTINAQNGIQVLNSTGNISGNTITGIGYAGTQNVYSGAVLAYGNTGLDITGNTITGANGESIDAKVVGIYIFDNGPDNNGGIISGNIISQVDEGLDVSGDFGLNGITIGANTVTGLDTTDPYAAGLYFEADGNYNGQADGASTVAFNVTGTDQNDVILGQAGADTFAGGAGVDTIDGGAGDDLLDGGAGIDSISGGAGTDTVTYGGTLTADDFAFTGGHWVVNGEALDGVERVTDGNGNTFLLVGSDGSDGFASIQAAVNVAAAGETVLVAQGSYAEHVTVTTNDITIQAVGDVTLQGGLLTENGIPAGGLAAFLKTATSYTGNAGTGVSIQADGITIRGLEINGFLLGVSLGNGADDTTLDEVALVSNMIGVDKATTATVTNFTMTGGLITDGHNGINFAKSTAPGDYNSAGSATGILIDGVAFSHLTTKGLYFEAASNAHITNFTMDDVGQFGTPYTWNSASPGSGGNGVDFNLKNGVYSNIEIDNFTLTNTGNSDRDGLDSVGHQNGGAIVIEGRDAGSYAGAIGTITGTVLVHDGSIDGTSTGVQAGEPGQANTHGPNVNVTNVLITNADHSGGARPHGDLTNVATTSTMVWTGTVGSESVDASQSTGKVEFTGGGGNDTLAGGAGSDTAKYAAMLASSDIVFNSGNNTWTVTAGAEGTDVLRGIEKIDDAGTHNILLVGAGGYATLQAAINAASAGDTIMIASGVLADTGSVTVDKALTILGFYHGVDGADGGRNASAESVLNGGLYIAADNVTVDGLKIVDGANHAGSNSAGIYIDHDNATIANSIVEGGVSQSSYGFLTPFGEGVSGLVIDHNLVNGWGQGGYFNPTTQFTVTNNTFTDFGNAFVGDDWAPGTFIDGNHFASSPYSTIGYGILAETDDLQTFIGPNNAYDGTGRTFGIFLYGDGLNDGDGQTVYGTDRGDLITAEYASVPNSNPDDTIDGRAGNDILNGGTGNDTLIGGDGTDTAVFSGNAAANDVTGATVAGFITDFSGVSGSDGADSVSGVEKLQFADVTLDANAPVQLFDAGGHLVGTFSTIQAAIDAASDGFTVRAEAGTYNENLTIDKAIHLEGANVGIAGTGVRGAETIINGSSVVSDDATIDGVRVLNSTNNTTAFVGISVVGNSDVTITNTVFYSTGVNGSTEDRAILLSTAATGHVTISNNLVTGAATGKFGASASWHRGIWSDGSTAELDITGNTFQYVRSGLNLDGYNDATTQVSGNTFLTGGTGVSMGTVIGSAITGIHDNVFNDVDSDFNLRNEADAQSFDLGATNNIGGGTGSAAVVYVLGTAGADTLTGTAGSDVLDARDVTGGAGFTDTAANTIDGKGGNDTVIGSNGDDVLTGGTGDDSVVGGGGSDTAVYSGNRAEYSFGGTTASATVTDNQTGNGDDGVDSLTGIEWVQFADRTMSLDALVNNAAPVVLGLDNQSVAENAADGTVVATAAASDPNAAGGDTVTFTLSDDADGRFAIDAVTGVITVTNGALLNAEDDLSHDITVVATDSGGLSATETFTITVSDIDEVDVTTPVDTDAAANSVAENSAADTVVHVTANATDGDATTNAVTYSLTDDAGGRFKIDSVTGVVTTTGASIDYEAATSHQITIKATSQDGSVASTNVAIGVTNVNEAPVITSNGGGVAASISVAENTTAVTTVMAADVDAGTTLTYSISGVDAAKFKINASTGALSFLTAPDFENPTDVGGNNVYDVVVQVSDGTLIDTQAIAVSVVNGPEVHSVVLTAGNDTYVAESDDPYVVDGLGGNDHIMTNAGADVVRGSGGNDTILTGGGDDIVTYLGTSNGADSVDGGAGTNDRIHALGNGAVIGLTRVTNVETISSNGFSNVKILGGSAADTLNFDGVTLDGIVSIGGGGGNDTITGSGSADTIDGGKGNDSVSGGGGNDLFLIGSGAGTDSYNGGSGSDTLQATVNNLVLTWGGVTDVETISSSFSSFKILGTSSGQTMDFTNVTLIGVDSIDGAGGNDSIVGSAGADTIIGGAGNDTLKGGDQDDLFLFAASAGTDDIDGGAGNDVLQASANNAILSWGTFSSVETISAGGFTNVRIAGTGSPDTIDLSGINLVGIASIDGGSGADTVIGSSGADTIVAGAGGDHLQGGGGDDTFLISGSTPATFIDGEAGTGDTIRATANGAKLIWGNIFNIEAIDGDGHSNVTIVATKNADTIDLSGIVLNDVSAIDGGIGADTIAGSSGSDTIIGGGGNDSLLGGFGDDTFLFAAGAGTDAVDGGDGFDVMKASAANVSFVWGNISNIEKVDGTGFGNVKIVGTGGNDVIDLSGIVLASIASIEGSGGKDTIIGSAGNDTIVGGNGADVLTGGAGADIFRYLVTGDTSSGPFDTITDFEDGIDKLDLSAIDANTIASGNQAFVFIGNSAFSGAAGQLRVDDTSIAGVIRVLGDTNGNGVADFEIRIDNSEGTIVFTGLDYLP